MIKLLIIADDFTGALDTAVQLSSQGIGTLVTIDCNMDFSKSGEGISALAVDIESRHIPAEQAVIKIKKLVNRAEYFGVQYFYKKTDSTLRGNVGSELEAMATSLKESVLHFIPAFPKGGRTTKDGIQYLNGVELGKTVFALDPREPVKTGSIAGIIAQQSNICVNIINLKESNSIAEYEKGKRIINVYDAASEEDLKEVVRHLMKTKSYRATAGCAGFAAYLPELLEMSPNPSEGTYAEGRLLIVSGSANNISIEQVKKAEKLGIAVFSADARHILDEGYYNGMEVEVLCKAAEKALCTKGAAAITVLRQREQMRDTIEYARQQHYTSESISERIMENLGGMAGRLICNHMAEIIIVFGGDTLYSIMKHIGCSWLRPLREIEPGVVLSRGTIQDREITIISKAGGFGTPEVIENIMDYLKDRRIKND